MTEQTQQLSRRTITSLAAATGVGVPLLAACGDDGGGTGTDDPTNGSSGGGSGELSSTADIEVGGGTIFADEKVVVTQPTEGDFKAFNTTCTHQGCQVGSVSDGTINCPCHGSKYSIEDGSPVAGPAPSPLGDVAITVEGDQITLA